MVQLADKAITLMLGAGFANVNNINSSDHSLLASVLEGVDDIDIFGLDYFYNNSCLGFKLRNIVEILAGLECSVQFPTFEAEPYAQGQAAAYLDNNPYQIYTNNYYNWNKGYNSNVEDK